MGGDGRLFSSDSPLMLLCILVSGQLVWMCAVFAQVEVCTRELPPGTWLKNLPNRLIERGAAFWQLRWH